MTPENFKIMCDGQIILLERFQNELQDGKSSDEIIEKFHKTETRLLEYYHDKLSHDDYLLAKNLLRHSLDTYIKLLGIFDCIKYCVSEGRK